MSRRRTAPARPGAEQRAYDYLRGASKTGEIAGRQVVLLVMVTYGDQSAARVAAGTRSRQAAPWAGEVDELMDKLVTDNVPDSALARLGLVLVKRRREQQEQQERITARTAREEAVARLDGIQEPICQPRIEQVAVAEQDLDRAWSGWTPRYSALRQQLAERRRQLAATGDQLAEGEAESGAQEQ